MYNTKKFKFIFTVLLLILLLFIYFKIFNKDKSIESEIEIENPDENSFSSNIISEVNFASKDVNGNSYNVTALEGEVDFSNNQIIYLKKIKASVKSKNLNKIVITSDFGKYDTENFNTIFSKNVIIKYLDNKITAEYMDFSMESNLMTISRNVVYTSLKNVLKADVIEMDINTKNAKIYMYEDLKKVKIKSKN